MNVVYVPVSLVLLLLLAVGGYLLYRSGYAHRLNVFDWFWGNRFFHYEKLEEDMLLVELTDVGDEFMMDFRLMRITKVRRRGPWIARRPRLVGYRAEWYCEDGVPVKPQGMMGSLVYANHVAIKDHIYWRLEADLAVSKWIRQERIKNGYLIKPIDASKISMAFDQMQLSLVGLAAEQPRFAKLQKDLQDLGKAGENASEIFKKLAEELDRRRDRGATLYVPPEDGEVIDYEGSEELKQKYTPEELAQQAINRDKEE